MNQFSIAVVLPDIRSAQNVGAILRTADATGVSLVATCGYTPHMPCPDDVRPPHVASANARAIAKAALGAEQTVPQMHFETLAEAIDYLRHHQYIITALEQSEKAVNLFDFSALQPSARVSNYDSNSNGSIAELKIAIILGNEVTGLAREELDLCDTVLEIPMVGQKESLNVSVAAGIALYHIRTI